jgi:hypothetical protein
VKNSFGWKIPDEVWDHAIGIIEDGCGINPEHVSPKYFVDNLAVNGDYGSVEEYLDMDGYGGGNENIDEFIERTGGQVMFLYDDMNSKYGKGVCYSL